VGGVGRQAGWEARCSHTLTRAHIIHHMALSGHLSAGKHTGRALVLPDGGVRLELVWGAPMAGCGYDELRCLLNAATPHTQRACMCTADTE
jgi:hypothetical protein